MKSLLLATATLLTGTLFAKDVEPLPKEEKFLSFRNEVRASLDRGLANLQKQQNSDGSFGQDTTHPALTAIALLALQREPTGTGVSADALQKGYAYLRTFAQPDGGIYNPEKGLANYNTSVALLALVGANDPKDADLIQKARAYVVNQQASGMAKPETDGGIGYGNIGASPKRGHPDLDNTLIALEALRATKSTLTDKPGSKDLDWNAAIAFIARCQNRPESNKEAWASGDPANKGGFVYYPGFSNAGEQDLPDGKKALRSYGSMTYAGLLSFIYADLKPSDPRVAAALEWLKKNYTLEENPGMAKQGYYYYFHLMAKGLASAKVKELELEGGKKVDWRNELGRKLINLQQTDGSWANEEGRWMEKNPALVTAYCVMSMEIIYGQL